MTEDAASPPATVDLAVLAGLEQDLAAVDAALVAIDAGEPGRSALLTDLLDEGAPIPAVDSTPA